MYRMRNQIITQSTSQPAFSRSVCHLYSPLATYPEYNIGLRSRISKYWPCVCGRQRRVETGRRRKMAVLPPQSVPYTTSGILRSGQTHCSSGVQPTLKAGKSDMDVPIAVVKAGKSDMDVPTAAMKAGKSNKIKKRPSQTTATARNLTTATTTTYQTNQNKHKK